MKLRNAMRQKPDGLLKMRKMAATTAKSGANRREMLTGKRSAGPFWMSRPVRSQFSSVPAIVTFPVAGLKAPPRPPPLPPLAGGILL
jgi:hypothetical protein